MNFLGRSISLLINGYKCVRFNGMIVLSSNFKMKKYIHIPQACILPSLRIDQRIYSRPKLLTERLTYYKGNIKYGPFLCVSKVK